ncbi:extracellular solute-binding protein [Bacillaceae bacterium SIJ1]|uniref:extracellular solute-binding protein n=1 Tax=Litoribacterium kuwaitense TaxID=1398745 RepID=UPI0013EDAC9F|nr:extracellular solute-binding protein [Litoribacterium kuwaitense]NGP45535.1 extracellular solute-binding protein [Litoribacterium kuwaitense]
MKKPFAVALSVLLSGSILAGCASDASNGSNEKEVITVWSMGSNNMKNTYELLRDEFNESSYGEKYVMDVEFISSGSGAQSLQDRVLAASKAGETETNFDIIEVSDQALDAFLDEGGDDFFRAIDPGKISNYENLEVDSFYGQDVMVPYRGTTVVLAYNSETVPNPPKTTDELMAWIKENPGRFAYNTPGTGGAGGSFVTTTVYNNLPEEALTSSDQKWIEEWQAGFKTLSELHPHMYQSGGKTVYPNKNQGTLDLLASKSIDMTPAWVDQIVNQKNTGILPDSIEMVQIEPAFTGNLASLALPTIGTESDGVYAVLDFMLSQEAQTILLDEMGAFPVVDPSSIDSKNADMLAGFNIDTFRTSRLGSLGMELVEKWDKEIATLE